MTEAGWTVHVLANSEAIQTFRRLAPSTARWTLEDFRTKTTPKGFADGIDGEWVSRLPDILKYSLVVSDNLLEILRVRPDAVICASFLWHRSVDAVDVRLFESHELLLTQHKPRVIAQQLFLDSSLQKSTTVHLTGLWPLWNRRADIVDSGDLLVSCGRSGIMEEPYRDLVQRIARFGPATYRQVWIDPQLLPADPPPWMVPATFTESMYSNILLGIIRPGVGTITDCVWAGARILCFFEPGNREMRVNANALECHQLGVRCRNVSEAIELAFDYATKPDPQKVHQNTVRSLDFSGPITTTGILTRLWSKRTW